MKLLLLLLLLIPLCTAVHGGRILQGETADYVAHAARVTGFSVAYSTEGSGTFVSLRHVVTAASVLHGMSIFQVYHGNSSMAYAKALSGLGTTHPLYDPRTFAHDIGLVVLGYPAASDLVRPIALPATSLSGIIAPPEGASGSVCGFGLRQDETRGWVLNFDMQLATVQVVDEGHCRRMLDQRQDLLAASHFCTDNRSRICYGHLGNGLTMPLDGRETLVGVVSVITDMCHADFPVLFTRVSLYAEWLRQQMDSE